MVAKWVVDFIRGEPQAKPILDAILVASRDNYARLHAGIEHGTRLANSVEKLIVALDDTHRALKEHEQ